MEKQSETVRIMRALGSGKRRSIGYLMISATVILFGAVILGNLIGFATQQKLTDVLYELYMNNLTKDIRYSIREVGMTLFIPKFQEIPMKFYYTMALLQFLGSLLIALIFIIRSVRMMNFIQKPAGKRKKKQELFLHQKNEKLIFAWIKVRSLKYALRSIVRNGIRSIIVPVTSFFLALLLLLTFLNGSRQEQKLEEIYERGTLFWRKGTFRETEFTKRRL